MTNDDQKPVPQDPLDLTPVAVMLRPSKSERDAWQELADANELSLSDCIRYAMADAAARPDLVDNVKAAMHVAKQERARSMQSQRWAGHEKSGNRPQAAAEPRPSARRQVSAAPTALDEPFSVGETVDIDLATGDLDLPLGE